MSIFIGKETKEARSIKIKKWITGLSVILLSLALCSAPKQDTSMGTLVLNFFQALFQNEEARQIFDLEEEEAVRVFGDEGEAVFL